MTDDKKHTRCPFCGGEVENKGNWTWCMDKVEGAACPIGLLKLDSARYNHRPIESALLAALEGLMYDIKHGKVMGVSTEKCFVMSQQRAKAAISQARGEG